jgi:hypothetical protein
MYAPAWHDVILRNPSAMLRINSVTKNLLLTLFGWSKHTG